MMRTIANKIEQNEDVAMVIITKSEGSCPRGKGSMMIVDRNGILLAGTIGGGAVEEKAKSDALQCIRKGISDSFSYNFDKDGGGQDSLPMICGGNIEVFINVFGGRDKLLIAGAGHIGQQLTKLAKMLNYWVAVLDNREDYVTSERFPEADELISGDIVAKLRDYPLSEKTSIVIVTHGHEFDEKALEAVINSDVRYIGMIGSREKIGKCFANLESRGIDKNKLLLVHTPIGLDLGGEGPAEIALAIMAEIQAVRHQRDGGFLSKSK